MACFYAKHSLRLNNYENACPSSLVSESGVDYMLQTVASLREKGC